MKMILAVIPPDHLNKLLDDLDEHHLHGLTVTEARGFGQHDRDFTEVEMAHKLRLEIACHDEEVETIINAIYKSAHTGRRGVDGKIFCAADSGRLMAHQDRRTWSRSASGPIQPDSETLIQ